MNHYKTNKTHIAAVSYVQEELKRYGYTINKADNDGIDFSISHPTYGKFGIVVVKYKIRSSVGATDLNAWIHVYKSKNPTYFACVVGDVENEKNAKIYYIASSNMCGLSYIAIPTYKCYCTKNLIKQAIEPSNLHIKSKTKKDFNERNPTKNNISKLIKLYKR